MKNNIMKIDLQMTNCDFGLNDNINNLIESSNKLIKLNNAITCENKQLRTKIFELEYKLQDVEKRNDLLYNEVEELKEKEQEFIQLINTNTKLILYKDLVKKSLEIIPWNLISEEEIAEIIEVLYELESYNNVIYILSNILQSKNNYLYDNKSLWIINEVSRLINIALDKEINNNDMLNLLDILYKTIDEDLLLEFTIENTFYINNLVLNSDVKLLDLNIKIGRIQFALEEFKSADIMLMILDEVSGTFDDVITIDVILMILCLTPYTDLKDIKGLNMDVLDSEYGEYKIIQAYFEALYNKCVTKELIEALEKESTIQNGNLSEITNSIRSIAYQHMAMKLSQLDEIIDIDNLKDENMNGLIEIDESLIVEDKIYIIKQKETFCPKDKNILIKKKIARKVYKTKHNLKCDINYEYDLIEIMYCDVCKGYYINQKLMNEIKGKISYQSIRGANTSVKKKTKYNDRLSIQIVDYQQYPTSKNNNNEIFLREKSPLKLMGYHTKLSNEKRWSILERKCIPDLGVNKVLYYLQGFIDRFSKQTKKDYSGAIGKWNYDIERIKEKYG